MRGRPVWAGSLAVLLAAVGVVALGVGPAGAEPPSDSARSGPVAGPVDRTGRVWRNVSGGAYHTCGVRTDRSLWCWGTNNTRAAGVG